MTPKPGYALHTPDSLQGWDTIVVPKDWSFLLNWFATVPSLLVLSPEAYEVRYADKPLILIGAVQLSTLTPERELWMLRTKHLNFLHLPALREMFLEWKQEKNFPLFARANTREKCRYLEFFGFIPHSVEDGITTYEAPK